MLQEKETRGQCPYRPAGTRAMMNMTRDLYLNWHECRCLPGLALTSVFLITKV